MLLFWQNFGDSRFQIKFQNLGVGGTVVLGHGTVGDRQAVAIDLRQGNFKGTIPQNNS